MKFNKRSLVTFILFIAPVFLLLSLLWMDNKVATSADLNQFYPTCFLAGPSGGIGGGRVGEQCWSAGTKISRVVVHSGRFVNGIQLYVTGRGNSCNPNDRQLGKSMGGNGGSSQALTLACDEDIKMIYGKYSEYVEHLTIVTTKNRYLNIGGPGGTMDFYYIAPPGYVITDIWGRSGLYIDAIGVVYKASGS